MKYIKGFKELNESIIMPKDIKYKGDLDTIASEREIRNICKENDFMCMKYDKFIKSLSEKDRNDAPGPSAFFALYHPKYKKPTFVISSFIPRVTMREIANILSHETIHQEQDKRSAIKYALPPGPEKDRRGYFSDKNEIMAFSYTIAKEISSSVNCDMESCIRIIKGLRSGKEHVPFNIIRLFQDLNRSIDDKTWRRYSKYIYQYCEEICKEE